MLQKGLIINYELLFSVSLWEPQNCNTSSGNVSKSVISFRQNTTFLPWGSLDFNCFLQYVWSYPYEVILFLVINSLIWGLWSQQTPKTSSPPKWIYGEYLNIYETSTKTSSTSVYNYGFERSNWWLYPSPFGHKIVRFFECHLADKPHERTWPGEPNSGIMVTPFSWAISIS